MRESRLVSRNVGSMAGRTSVRLEPELWDGLEEMCRREQVTLGDLVRRIDGEGRPGGRTSALRVHVFQYFRAAATEQGHRAAGHKPLEAGRRPGMA